MTICRTATSASHASTSASSPIWRPKLDAMPEGEGTVLDNCCLLWLSNMWAGWKHDNMKLPVVLAGGLGGALKTGRSLDYLNAGDENRSSAACISRSWIAWACSSSASATPTRGSPACDASAVRGGLWVRGGANRGAASDRAELAAGREAVRAELCGVHGSDGEGGKGRRWRCRNFRGASDLESLGTIVRRGIEGTEMPSTRLGRRRSACHRRLGAEPRRGRSSRRPGNRNEARRCTAARRLRRVSCGARTGRGDRSGFDRRRTPPRRRTLRASLREPDAELFKGTSIYRNDISITENFLLVTP